MKQWVGRRFDPERFDPEAPNKRLPRFRIGSPVVGGRGCSGQTMSAGQELARDSAAVPWSGRVMVDATSKRVERLVGWKRKELAVLDDEFFGEVVGVAEAIYALRTALKQISAALNSRQFEKASAIGYGKGAEGFVFLQRTLADLQGACLRKEKLVPDLALTLRCPYEDVLPKVNAVMQSARPLDRRQRIASRKKVPQIRAAIEALTRNFGKDAKAATDRARRRGGRT